MSYHRLFRGLALLALPAGVRGFHGPRPWLLAAAFCLLSASGSAFTFLTNETSGLALKWPDGNVAVRLMMGESPTLIDGSTYNASVRTATEIWNSKLGSIQLQATIATGTATENNQINEVFMAENVFGRAFVDDAVAVATRWRVGNRRTESDIIYNTKYKFNSYRGALRSERREWVFDVQRLALHELGHALGLNHPNEAGQTVAAVMNAREHNLDNLTTDDIQGAQTLYGVPGVVPANDNLANATALAPGTDNTVVVQGSSVLATKEPGEPNHAGYSGGHSVWYKWTAAANGGATVSTLGSYFNTTVAVYTGTSASSLTQIGANNDVEADKVLTSKLLFYAKSGTTYVIAVDGANSESAGLTLTLGFDPNAIVAPVIVTHPAAVSVNTGGSANLSVVANGSEPLAYQWNFNGTPIANATAATYSLANVTTSQGGNYTVTVSNPAGTAISNGAALTVTTPPPPPPAASGGGGGGGAPSLWFCITLLLLGLGRLRQSTRR